MIDWFKFIQYFDLLSVSKWWYQFELSNLLLCNQVHYILQLLYIETISGNGWVLQGCTIWPEKSCYPFSYECSRVTIPNTTTVILEPKVHKTTEELSPTVHTCIAQTKWWSFMVQLYSSSQNNFLFIFCCYASTIEQHWRRQHGVPTAWYSNHLSALDAVYQAVFIIEF